MEYIIMGFSAVVSLYIVLAILWLLIKEGLSALLEIGEFLFVLFIIFIVGFGIVQFWL
jgi:hypothetical protein